MLISPSMSVRAEVEPPRTERSDSAPPYWMTPLVSELIFAPTESPQSDEGSRLTDRRPFVTQSQPLFSTFTPAIHSTQEKEEGLQTLLKLPFRGDVCTLSFGNVRNLLCFCDDFWLEFHFFGCMSFQLFQLRSILIRGANSLQENHCLSAKLEERYGAFFVVVVFLYNTRQVCVGLGRF